jgi:hypothetical protein
MILIKKKSLVVALISSFIICCVLVLTLVGYIAYMELKDNELKSAYHGLLDKINARIYSRHIDVSGLGVEIENYGALRGKPVLSGVLKNTGYREVSDVLMRVKLLDGEGAVLYEVVFHPQEPSLGYSELSQVAIPYLYRSQKSPIKRGEAIRFKKILANCPKEITAGIKRSSSIESGAKAAGAAGKGGSVPGRDKWYGRIEPEIMSVGF